MSGAGARRSPAGLIGAVAIHAAIVAATLFTWQHHLDIVQESPPVVPVDLVTIGQKTNIAPTVRPARKIAPQEPVTGVQPDKPIDQQPVVQQEQAKAAPPPPEQAPPEPLAKPPLSLVVPKAKPQADNEKSTDADEFQALLNKITSSPTQTADAKTAAQTRRGAGAQSATTMDLVDALRNEIFPCWSPPVGAPNPAELVVTFDIFLNLDGSVAQPPQLTADSAAAAGRNPYARAAAEAGERAIYACAPYKLPVDRYAQWREINPFMFDPRQMLGQ
jgi:outer membrane biosynthesis protein TonB